MSRVKRGVTTKKRHKRLLSLTKGFRGNRSRVVKRAKEAAMKAGINAYVGRRVKKRDFRTLWNARINAAVRPMGLNYSRLISMLFKKQVLVNRKMLSELAIQHAEAFSDLVKKVQ